MTSWLLTATIAYGLMMFASSFVEEEQQFWYWMMSAWSGWVFLKQYLKPSTGWFLDADGHPADKGFQSPTV